MILFTQLNKQEKEQILPELFDLLYDNMSVIIPAEVPYAQQREQWLANVSPALEKAPRNIILCFVNNVLAGYLQYYTTTNLIMIEEIQLKKPYQKTTVFYSFCKYLIENLPPHIEIVEAYADKRNLYSQDLMKKLGMSRFDEETDSSFLHMRGSVSFIKRYFR